MLLGNVQGLVRMFEKGEKPRSEPRTTRKMSCVVSNMMTTAGKNGWPRAASEQSSVDSSGMKPNSVCLQSPIIQSGKYSSRLTNLAVLRYDLMRGERHHTKLIFSQYLLWNLQVKAKQSRVSGRKQRRQTWLARWKSRKSWCSQERRNDWKN